MRTRAMLSIGFAVALPACGASHAYGSAWIPEREPSSSSATSSQPIDRLCLPERRFAARITIACAGFDGVSGVALDADGNLYVSSSEYGKAGTIFKIETGGRTSPVPTVALWGLNSVAVDLAGRVFASATVYHGLHPSAAKVYEFVPRHSTPIKVFSGLSYAYGLAADAGGNVYAAIGHGILKIDSNGKRSKIDTAVQAVSIAVDSAENVYATDGRGGASKIAVDGTVTRLPVKNVSAKGIAVDAAGDAFVNGEDARLYEISAQGDVRTVASGIHLSGGLALTSDGTLYAGVGQSVARITAGGAVTTVGPTLSAPFALASDAAGGLYVVLVTTGKIVRIDPGGSFTTIASHVSFTSGMAVRDGSVYLAHQNRGTVEILSKGGGARIIAKGLFPTGIAVDSRDNAYVSDGKYVKRIDARGNVVTVFTLADEQLVTTGVAVDARGNVYVAVGSATEDCVGGLYKVGRNGAVAHVDPGRVSCLSHIVSDADGTVYVSSRGGIVSRIGTDGRIKMLASRMETDGLALDGRGHLYVSATNADEIYRISL